MQNELVTVMPLSVGHHCPTGLNTGLCIIYNFPVTLVMLEYATTVLSLKMCLVSPL